MTRQLRSLKGKRERKGKQSARENEKGQDRQPLQEKVITEMTNTWKANVTAT